MNWIFFLCYFGFIPSNLLLFKILLFNMELFFIFAMPYKFAIWLAVFSIRHLFAFRAALWNILPIIRSFEFPFDILLLLCRAKKAYICKSLLMQYFSISNLLFFFFTNFHIGSTFYSVSYPLFLFLLSICKIFWQQIVYFYA